MQETGKGSLINKALAEVRLIYQLARTSSCFFIFSQKMLMWHYHVDVKDEMSREDVQVLDINRNVTVELVLVLYDIWLLLIPICCLPDYGLLIVEVFPTIL